MNNDVNENRMNKSYGAALNNSKKAIKIVENILRCIKKHPYEIMYYKDFVSHVKQWQEDKSTYPEIKFKRTPFHHPSHKYNLEFTDYVRAAIKYYVSKHEFGLCDEFTGILFQSLLLSASEYFDYYLQAVEFGKPLGKQFYLPRRHYLKRYVKEFQKVKDGELDFLSVSMPKRTGKSQMGINFVCWISGIHPNGSTLMEGTGTALVNSFYKGILEYLDPQSEYHYYDIFPDRKIVERSAEMMTFNFDKKSRFPTVMCRSIDQTQVGLSEATNILYLDDCVDGRVEARNRDLLDKKWEVISADVVGRAIEGTPIVICGTRYSIYDPIGRLQDEMRKQGKRIAIIEIPALDLVTDGSNFAYMREGEMVFTTKYFRDQRMMISAEQFESEFQQMPFEAKGLLFPKDQLLRFERLPEDKEPDAVVTVCDTADKGEDYCVQICAYIYGPEVYIEDVICDDSPAKVTKPRCAKQIIDHHVRDATYESNNAGDAFGKDVEKIVKEKNGVCNFRFPRSISNKQTRIEFASDNILAHFHFKYEWMFKSNDDYAIYLRQLCTYTRRGKVPHDDAPDATAMLEDKLRTLLWPKPEILARRF